MKPLLAHVYEPHRVTYPCYVQPKLNGIRALYQDGHFQSRDEIPFPTGLLDHLAKPLKEIFGPDVILDGELYRHDWPLQRINAAVTPVRQTPTEDTLMVQYHVFDVVDFTKSFSERMTITDEGQDTFIPTLLVKTQQEADNCYAYFVKKGYEGLMYRLGDCPYTAPKQHWAQCGPLWNIPKPRTNFLSDKANRCWHLLKRKSWCDAEFRCVGWEYGKPDGKYANMVGALICITPEGKQFTVSGGLTDEQRVKFLTNPPTAKLIKVQYLMFSTEGKPINPTIEAILH